ncbi:class I tRNA ligase family protein, partial [Tabrizicola sp.]|uniref:class I tRNA ligase family protein n=1 Tax=Tabrizicola sp. TaxID=2005166 RepID=UPI00286A5BE7
PQGDFAHYWLHNEMLQVEGKKMSKSLGNFFTVRDLLDQGVPGEVIRFVLLSTHYRKPMDWTKEKAVEAELRLHGFVELVSMYGDLAAAKLLDPDKAVVDALSDDVNTHEALTALMGMNGSNDATRLARNIEFLGLLSWQTLEVRVLEHRRVLTLLGPLAEKLQRLRIEAKKNKDFSEVDEFKAKIAAANVSIMMTADSVDFRPEINVSVERLEALL